MVNRGAIALVLLACLTPSTSHAASQCGPWDPYLGVRTCAAFVPLPEAFAMSATQAQDEWCWAASISMVFRHYGYDVPQARIVSDAWGAPVDMPGTPQQIVASLNRTWVDAGGRAFTAAGDVFSANPVTAVQDLDADHPLVIGASGHAMVLASLTFLQDAYGAVNVTEAYVVDPWPGQGIRMLSPQEWYGTSFLARVRVSPTTVTPPTTGGSGGTNGGTGGSAGGVSSAGSGGCSAGGGGGDVGALVFASWVVRRMRSGRSTRKGA